MVDTPRIDGGALPRPLSKRRWWTRLSSTHIVVAVAAALAFVANLAALRPETPPPLVAVAAEDLLPGTVFRPSVHADLVPMTTDPEVLATIVGRDTMVELRGTVLARPVRAGSPLTRDLFRASAAGDAARLMSVPVEAEYAAGGEIVEGDLVDLIAVEDGVASFVVTGAEVVRVPSERTGFASSGASHLVLAVDARAALAISEALDRGTTHVVRSTGAPTVEAGDDG